jgi:rare lipoprotein A
MGIRRSDPFFGVARGVAAAAACLALANCSSSGIASRIDPKYGVSSSPRVVALGDPVPKGGGTYRVGKPYVVAGRVYVPEEDVNYREEGLASWYGDDFHVNDRGPYHNNRLMDVSSRAAELLEFKNHGVARVRVEYVGRAPLEGSDDRQLVATLRTGIPAPSPSLVRLASARPFVPEISPSARQIRGEVPLPEERPYSLGNTSADQASISATSEMSASARRSGGRVLENPRAVSYAPDDRYSSGLRPVSAYAPIDPQGPSELLAGRGLY